MACHAPKGEPPARSYTKKGYAMDTKPALRGLKVVDFGVLGVNPMTMRYLADHGATVVRIEAHNRFDTQRLMRPFKDGKPGLDRSGIFPFDNSSKLDVTVDLAKPRGKELGLRFIKWADVVGEGYRPGTMKKLGLDYASARKVNPGIIYFSTCMLGQNGPHAAFKGFGYQAASLAGFYNLMGWPGKEPSGLFGAYTDWIAPRFAIAAIMSALDYRRRTGKGQYIEQSQVESAIHLIAPLVMDYQANGRDQGQTGNRLPCAAPHGVYPCRGEDRWVAITVFTEEEWQALSRTIGDSELTRDSQFASPKGRKAAEDRLDKLIGEWTAKFTAEDLMARLQAAGVAAGVVEDVKGTFEDVQLKYREHYRYLNHPVIGPHAYNALAFRLSKTPDCQRPAPTLGQHNDYVFKELLGMSDDEIADMLIERVITTDADLPEHPAHQ